jgi:hypothetical protein
VKHFIIIACILLNSLLVLSNEPLKKDSIIYPIRIINFDNSFRTDTTAIDTNISKLHILNLNIFNDISYTYLTRSGYPVISNNIKTRLGLNDYFFPANYLYPYIQDEKATIFYSTKRFYSSLTYKFAGAINNKEEFLQVIHTRGLSDHTNIGLHYNLFSNNSKNDLQQTNDHSLNVFFRNSGKKYLSYYQLYYNSFSFSETGGVSADSLIEYNSDIINSKVNLKNTSSKFIRFGFNSNHELKINQLFNNIIDTVNDVEKDYGSIIYKISLETNKKSYYEKDSNVSFYNKHYYSKNDLLNDSIILDKLTNKILLNSPQLIKYLPNLRLSATNVIYNSFHGRVTDTVYFNNAVNKQWQSYDQTWITTDVSQKIGKFWLNFVWDTYILGYGLGDQSLRAIARLYADSAKTMSLEIIAGSDFRKPSFLLNSIYSNHYIWNKGDSLNRVKKQELSGLLSLNNLNTSVSASYYIYSDMVYFTSSGVSQTHENLHIFNLTAKNKVYFWKFSTENVFTYQEFNEKYFHLPKVIFYNSTEFQHTFKFSTGGRLYSKLGVDFKYQTKYKPDTYIPALGVFALSNESDNLIYWAGNYPVVDVHLSFKVKNVSFYIKYSHLNSFYSVRAFNAAHYYMLPATLSYGINWLFYD